MYPYAPQNDDELELVTGDFIFMSPVEQSSARLGVTSGHNHHSLPLAFEGNKVPNIFTISQGSYRYQTAPQGP